jgi:hypothetical protein
MPIPESETPSRSPVLRAKWLERAVDFVLVPVLVLVALWLPPASLGERLLGRGMTPITAEDGGVVAGPEGASLTVPQGAVGRTTRIEMTAVESEGRIIPADELAAAIASGNLMGLKSGSAEVRAIQALPAGTTPRGALYRLAVRGAKPTSAELTLPLAAGIEDPQSADAYAWDADAWHWLPSAPSAEGTSLVARTTGIPQVVAIVQRAGARAEVAVDNPAAVLPLGASRVYMGAAELPGDYTGSLGGDIPDGAQAEGASAILRLTNLSDGVVRTDLLANMLMNPADRAAHVSAIVAALKANNYAGVEVAYQGVAPAQRNDATAFVRELGAALHAEGLLLALPLDGNAAAIDWAAAQDAVDIVRLSAPEDPAAYAAGGEMDNLLTAATRAVDRRKLELAVSVEARDVSPSGVTTMPYQNALGLLASRISLDDAGRLLLPGEPLTASLPDLVGSPIQYQADAHLSWFAYRDASGAQHVVWLENGASVAHKLQYVSQYGLGNVAIEGWTPEGADAAVAEAVDAFDQAAVPDPQFALVWSLSDAAGSSVQRQVAPANAPAASWSIPANPGDYVISAALSADGGQTSLGRPAQASFSVPSMTPTPLATPTPSATPPPPPTETPLPTDTPDVAATATALALATPTPTAAALPPAPPPSGSAAGFGYGVQPDMITDGNHDRIFGHIQGMGFNWVKQQVEWFRYNPAPGVYDWGALDRIVEGANARGINVLFSVVKAPAWARPAEDTDQGPPADPNTYGTFMREMAARYKGRVRAYEIWNEQNLYYEWGGRGGKINAARYVQLLAVAYSNIKAVDPGAVVVSGALTPTGVNDGDIAIDDRAYLEQMYQAGLRNYCDAVGAHPSGYNNPPDADWRSYNDPNEANCKGHPSWFFRGTMEGYRNIMVKYGDAGKRIWATEFGWASVENLGVAPAGGYEYAAQNTEGEQAQFLVRAYQMGRSWGWVGPMFLWNLNFGPVSGAADEKAAFGIVRPDWSPRPAYDALRDMGK